MMMAFLQDPADEDEQAKVMSQAQALLDCVADLVSHCGVLAAVDMLAADVILDRSASWTPGAHSADSWRVSGRMSADNPGVILKSWPLLRIHASCEAGSVLAGAGT